MYITLSYTLSVDAPIYQGNPEPLVIEPVSRISKGDTSNKSRMTIFNHDGSHLDGPQHFNKNSTVQLASLDLNRFIFTNPVVIDLDGKIGDKIFPKDIEPFAKRIQQADFLLIRTGYAKFRESDRHKYTREYPVFSKELAACLIQDFDSLQGVGVDCVSIGSRKFREDGVKAHQILTGVNESGKYLFILEDVNIPKEVLGMKKLFVIPFFIELVDSLPVTVFCEL